MTLQPHQFNEGDRIRRGKATICPRCQNVIATRITTSGVTTAPHQASPGRLCK